MMKKFFNRLGGNEDGKGKKASGRASDGLVRTLEAPAGFNQSPLLLTGGPAENGNPDRDASDTPPNRPVPSFITNSVNLPTYGKSGAVPLPLPSEPLALPLPEPSSSPPSFAPNSQGSPHCLPTEDSLSPGGFGFSNQAPTQGDASTALEIGKGVSTKCGLTISRTGPNNPGFSSPRPHPSPGSQKGLAAVFKNNARSNQGPLLLNFPNQQRPTPLIVLSGLKRGQISKPIADATASEPSASPQLVSELPTPSPNLTPRSAPEWTSSVPPVSPFWPRTSPGSANPHHNKLRRSPSLNSNPDSSSDLSNTSSPLSRFSPVGQANQAANPHLGLAKNGKSAPSSPARSEKLDAFGSGNSVGSAVSEPPLSIDSAELNTVQSEKSEQDDDVGPLLSPSLEERGAKPVLARKLLGFEEGGESKRDDTSEEGSSAGGSQSTESSAAGTWLNAGHSPNRAANQPPRVHFDLNEGKAGVPSSLRGGLLSPKAAHVLGIGDDSSPVLSPQPMLDTQEAPRHPEGWKKEVGEEDLTQSITPRTAEALQGEVGRQKRTPKKAEGSQAGSPVPLGGRSPQKTAGGAASRLQRPVNTHLNVPKQLTPITAGPAWHESIAGLPGVASSERPSSALQAHPLPDIDQAYTPPSSTPSPKDGASLPPTSASSARSVGRAFPNRNIPSPEHLPHHIRATSAPSRSNDSISPNSGKPIRLSEVGGSRNTQNESILEGGNRAKVIRGQSEPIARALVPEPGYVPKAEIHHLPLSEATRTLSDPILPRVGQRRTSLDQDATPLPLPLPPVEQKPGKGVSPAQMPISPAQPSPLPALPPTGYPLTQNLFYVSKASTLVSPSQLIAARSLSPHPSPSSVLQQGDRNSKDYRGGAVDAAHPGPKMPVNWRKGNELGRGTFGSVYRGLNIDNGEMFAVKEVGEAQQNVRDESMSQLEHEISLLSNLKHPNIVQYIGTKREEGNLYIFLEYMSGGSIESLLRSYDFFEEPLIRFYTKQILCGLKYLHDQSTIHRDIKGANILVDNRGRVALADFGMAKQICEAQSLTKSGIKGSAFWMAPEVVRHEPGDGRPADIWSVGCTVLEMAVGVPPWSRECNNLIAVLYKIASCKDYPHIPEHLSETAVDFIKLCLNRSPESRPNVNDLLTHPFIADVAPEMSDVLSPSTPSPRPVAPVVPRKLHRTSQTPANSRLVRQRSGRLREAIEEEESVSATVAALVDAPSPRASGSKGLSGVGSNSGKNLGGGPKSRPQTPPPNWSPSGDEPKPGPTLGANMRLRDVRGSAQELDGSVRQSKPSLRWKSPSSIQSNALSSNDAARSVEDSFRFGDPRIETRSPLPLTRHKSADAPTRRPLRTLLEDGPDDFGRLQKGVSVPLEVTRRKSSLERGGEIDMFQTSKQMG